MSELKDRIEQINARMFALEGRMTTFEEVSRVQGQARTDLLEAIIENQAADRARYEQDKRESQERVRGAVVKISIGIGLLIITKLLEFAPVLFSLLHKP